MDSALAKIRLVDAALDVAEMLNQNTLDRIDDIELRTKLAQLDRWAKNYRQTRKPQPRPTDNDDNDFVPAPCG